MMSASATKRLDGETEKACCGPAGSFVTPGCPDARTGSGAPATLSKKAVTRWRFLLDKVSSGVTFSWSPNFDADLQEVVNSTASAPSESDYVEGWSDETTDWRPLAFALFVALRHNTKLRLGFRV